MRKFVATSLLGFNAFIGVSPADATTILPEQCEIIYDETRLGDALDPELTEYIGMFAAEGTEVHVQAHYDARDNGVAATADLPGYSDEVSALCEWNQRSTINIFTSTLPSAYDVLVIGDIDDRLSDAEINSAVDAYIPRFHDKVTPYQQDAALLLKDLYDLSRGQLAPEQSVNPDEPFYPNEEYFPDDESDQNPTESSPGLPDWRYDLILAGLIGTGTLGAGGLRLKRGRDIKAINNSVATTIDGSMTVTVLHAEQKAAGFRPDDTVELQNLAAQSRASVDQIIAERQSLMLAYANTRRSFWPGIAGFSDKAEAFHTLTSRAEAHHARLIAEIDQIDDYLKQIEARVSTYNTDLSALHATAAAMTQDGWDIGPYNDTLDALDAQQAEILQLRELDYVVKPSDIIVAALPEIHRVASKIAELPTERNAADQCFASNIAQIPAIQQTVIEAQAALLGLLDTYDESCHQDVSGNGDSIQTNLSLLQKVQQDGSALLGQKSYESLAQTNGLNAVFASTLIELQNQSAAIHSREQQLEAIQSALPRQFDDLSQKYSGLHDYAFDQYAGDIEDPTRQSIANVADAIRRLQQAAKEHKPKYLELARDVADLSETYETIKNQAVAEHHEMVRLRESVVELEQAAEREARELLQYISRHSSDVNISGSFAVDDAQTQASRSQLRSQVAAYKDTIREIHTAQQAAENDVRRANQRRAEAAAAAARAATAAANRANRNHGGGGSRGSGGGGHRRSGGGGTRRSGG